MNILRLLTSFLSQVFMAAVVGAVAAVAAYAIFQALPQQKAEQARMEEWRPYGL